MVSRRLMRSTPARQAMVAAVRNPAAGPVRSTTTPAAAVPAANAATPAAMRVVTASTPTRRPVTPSSRA